MLTLPELSKSFSIRAMDIGSKIKEARIAAELSQEKLGSMIVTEKNPRGVSRAAVNNWEKGKNNPEVENLVRIAEVTDRSVDYFIRSDNEYYAIEIKSTLSADEPPSAYNVEVGPSIKGQVPVISWVQAGEWCEIIDNFQPGDADEWMPCPVMHGPHTYALVVRGESMYNPHGRPSFLDGDIIFVDPDKSPANGSLVVCRLDHEKEATFKKLVIEGGGRYLRPLNPSWPQQVIEIDADSTICGVVIFKGEKL